MSITVLRAENFERVHAGIDAAVNRNLAFWVDLKMAAIEEICIVLVVLKKCIGDLCERIF